jgi:hypothetical protein
VQPGMNTETDMFAIAFRVLAFTFLGAWLLLSVLTVIQSRWISGRRRWDVFQMLSGWRLFIAADHASPAARRILFRDRLRDGSFGPWVPVAQGTIPWSFRGLFWNPEWEAEVLFRRLAKELQREIGHRRTGTELEKLLCYRHLVHIVSRFPRSSISAEARQFVILATYGQQDGRPPVCLFESGFLRL